ncbi:MAG: VCBS repeat-containing protein [Reichenbachiella sp.]|uniref:VCBS repeat-containing protein n=1 Tax=Reichenbachiella sp. TaxID=2184521 RepID=UPI003267D347
MSTKTCTFLLSLLFISNFCNAQKKIFELVPFSKSNITFNNKIADTKESNILIYSNFYGGAGVGVGDFNNDGLQDLFFAGNLVKDELYLNEGNFEFRNITKKAGIKDNGGWSSGVVVGDVNNDGWQDIYVTRELYDDKPDLRRNKLYINNGDLTFSESGATYGADHSGRTRHAVFLDYNKDGWLDLFLLTQPPNPGSYSTMRGSDLSRYEYAPVLLKNTGKGYFEDASKESGLDVPGFPNSVSATDFNNDGWVDLYLSNDFQAPDKLYINQQDGTFENKIDGSMGHITYFSMGVDAADINNDGLMDISVLDMAAEDNFRVKANMSGMNPETFWKLYDQGGHYQYMYNSLQLNNGSFESKAEQTTQLSFSDVAQLSGTSSTDWSWSNLIADFDNDGKKDLYITNGLLKDIRNTDGDKKVSDYIAKVIYEFILANPNVEDVGVWDILDLDKALSLLPSSRLSNYAYKNNSGLSFTNATAEWGLDHQSFSNGSSFVDLNNDGALDLVVSNINDEAFVFRNQANEVTNNNYINIRLDDNNAPIFGCKVNVISGNDSQWYEFTSVRGMYSCSEQLAHFGLGKSEKVDKLIVYWNDETKTERKNVAANQQITISKATNKSLGSKALATSKYFKKVDAEGFDLNFSHQENDFDDYAKQVLLPHKMSQFGPALAVADVNGDGLDDMYIGGATGQAAILYFQNQDGRFRKDPSNLWVAEARYEDIDAAFVDFDQDGDLDLYVVSGGNAQAPESRAYQDRLYRNMGNGRYEKFNTAIPAFYESGSCVRFADFDQDGDQDLFVGGRHMPWDYPKPTSSRIMINENGVFKDITQDNASALIDIGMVTDAVWTDFDQDGRLDLIMVGEWMPITFIRNTDKGFYNATADFGLSHTTGWWNSIGQGDLDGDGHLDYVLGNLGLNYKYKASENEPFEVYYRDFDKNGKNDIVLSYYNFGEKYPLRGRSCSAEQVPELKQKFDSYDLFASANLYDVYGDGELSLALNYSVQSFAHIQLKSLGQGKFEIRELPEYTQLSSLNDVIISDIDGDQASDILAIGNNFPVEIETPRNDAGKGVVLLNNDGNLKVSTPLESGFYVPNDAKKMAFIRINNALNLVVANNNYALELFQIVD